jgi:hypothetical protein
MEIMKRYTFRALIHDAKFLNQLRLEYRRSKKDRRKNCLFKLSVALPEVQSGLTRMIPRFARIWSSQTQMKGVYEIR